MQLSAEREECPLAVLENLPSSSQLAVLFCVSSVLYSLKTFYIKRRLWDFPGGAVVKNLPANAGDTGSSPGPGRSHIPQSY